MIDGLDDLCARALAEHGCASVSVAVAEGDRVVFARAYGLADVAARRTATPGTVYGLASITKAFTATAVCLAADDGLVDLDAPIGGSGPTPRQLLQHRGGYPAFYGFHYDDGPPPVDIARYRRLVREPGSDFEYSNIGYQDLGALVEAVTGQDLGGYLRERIAEPLQLSSFGYGAGYPAAARRYSADGRAYATCHTDHPAASAGWATARDVALFARTANRLLRPATVAAMFAAEPVNEQVGYGFGRVVSPGPGPVTHSHGGGMGGIATMMIDLPEHDTSVAVLTNCTDKSARDAVVAHLVGGIAAGFSNQQVNPITEQVRPMTLQPGAWAGEISTSEGDVPLRLTVLAEDQVEIRLADQPPAVVRAEATTRWDLRTSLQSQLPTGDARVNSPHLALELRVDGELLTGRASAYKDGDREGWLGAYLVHSCELRPCGQSR
ncbi:serine hydrolase domain-containing protein [Asanoa iriomotensis]|uniref:Beta-lactamase-related domain-containing protein n=1 Tax=Asanoa iriomotensis TaxID=234613 RepID=A0ABQ4BWE9_9ACTN|nr:serine hydrolase domain-containing protein [Asanoa iriomotensis]GIF54852.1 hypothetical protein Air01nite_09470 [Asanoa iriomotensis]